MTDKKVFVERHAFYLEHIKDSKNHAAISFDLAYCRATIAQPVQPILQSAAQAVLERWDSPQWEWAKHGPTADLMHALRKAIAQPVPKTGKWQAIETAPKETLVLVYTPPQPDDWPNTVRINFDYICQEYEDWHDHCESFEHYMAVGGSNACGSDEVCTGPSEKAPYTHWMPIPDAPDSAFAQPVQPVQSATEALIAAARKVMAELGPYASDGLRDLYQALKDYEAPQPIVRLKETK